MKSNQVDYFNKVINLLKELKEDYPDIEMSKHYSLATDCGTFLSDKELFYALQKHKSELDLNPYITIKDTEKIIEETNALFEEVDDSLEDEEDPWDSEDNY